ncbi:MAG: bacteriocin fulvocin C-related protein [Acidobacteria bacterium]|nr:bacteriocin fulvocin C-related protein [Acidobacteriota bacterium]
MVTVFVTIQRTATANNKAAAKITVNSQTLTRYKEFCSLSKGERKKFYANAPAKDRGYLWKAHLATYLGDHPDLTKPQVAVIAEGFDLINSPLFGLPGENTGLTAQLKAHEAMALAVFPEEEAGKIFTDLGTPLSPSIANSEASGLLGDCQCSTSDSWCSTRTGHCFWGGGICTFINNGCGWFYQYTCNGIC